MMIDELNLDPVDFAKILADDTRQQIMSLCCCRWVSVSDLQRQLNVTQPTVSHHLSVLRESGLVSVRSKGRQVFYRLNQPRVASCCENLRVRFTPDHEEQEAGPS